MMENKLSSKHFLRISLLIALSLTSLSIEAQEKTIAIIPLQRTPVAAYVDRPGDLYLEFNSGNIKKFDVNGKLIQEVDVDKKYTIFEPRDGSRAFVYSNNGGWYSYALFGSLQKTTLKEEFAVEPALVCSSGDKNIWILDKADLSIKKINTQRGTVDVETLLPDPLRSKTLNIISIREYQNFLFLLDLQTGIHIFNPMGKLIRTIEGKGIPYFNFLGEELYYPRQSKLIFHDLFDNSIRETDIDPSIRFILLTDERTFRIFEDRVEILPSNP